MKHWLTDGCVIWCRYELIGRSRCNITLVTNLRREDNNRAWRCQVTTKGNIRPVFQDFTSRFLFEDAPTDLIPPADVSCPVHLPISRIMLCVALPIMVIIVSCTKRGDRRRVKTSAAGIELQEVNCWSADCWSLCLFLSYIGCTLLKWTMKVKNKRNKLLSKILVKE